MSHDRLAPPANTTRTAPPGRYPLRYGARRVGAGLLLAAGIAAVGTGLWVPAKATLGQWLLARAFEEAAATGTPARPWAWADFMPVARISSPRIGVREIALDTTAGAAMAWGPGAVPGLGRLDRDLVAFAGHRDTHLAFLARLRPGDTVTVEAVDGIVRSYRVADAMVVDSRHWRFPGDMQGLVLATCWPLDAQTPGPLRLIVRAERLS